MPSIVPKYFIVTPESGFLCALIFLTVAVLNYALLYDEKKHSSYVNGEISIPKYAYVVLFLFFAASFLTLSISAQLSI